jgi:hypothetical protein
VKKFGAAMRRIRLGTLLLLVVIASLCFALVAQHRREAELQARLAEAQATLRRVHIAAFAQYEPTRVIKRPGMPGPGGGTD